MAALFSFLRGAPDFEAVVKNAILAGGDTDTTAARSGALCGALVGEEAMNSYDWRAALDPNGARLRANASWPAPTAGSNATATIGLASSVMSSGWTRGASRRTCST